MSRWSCLVLIYCASLPELGCKSSSTGADLGVPADLTAGDLAAPPPAKVHVAAVQYGDGDFAQIAGCTTDACALVHLIDEAAANGAKLVVTPEYALPKVLEPTPAVGSVPQKSATPVLGTMSERAAANAIYLVVGMFTYDGSIQSPIYRNSQVAFGPDGKVLAVHFKFGLFENEVGKFTPGTDVFVFPSPVGLTGLLICADIYSDPNGLETKLVQTLKARVVAVSLYWTTDKVKNRLALFSQAFGVYTIAANTTHPPGEGGGVFDSGGMPLAWSAAQTPGVVYADIPASD